VARKKAKRPTKMTIEVLQPGAMPGHKVGDVIENPTQAQIERAMKNPTVLRITKWDEVGGEVDADNSM